MWNRRKEEETCTQAGSRAQPPAQPSRPQPPKEGIPMSTVPKSPDRVHLMHPHGNAFVLGTSVS